MEKTYEKIKDRLGEDIKDILKKTDMNMEELECLGKAVDILKDISTIETMDKYGGIDEYSSASFAVKMPKTYTEQYNERSMRRGRSPITGRYVSRNNMTEDMEPTMRYSMDYEPLRSRHSINDRIVDALERMYGNAVTEHEKSVLNYWIQQVDSK